MDGQNKTQTPGDAQQPSQTEGIEDLYGGLQKVPLKLLDLFIGLCIAALVIVIAVGVLNR